MDYISKTADFRHGFHTEVFSLEKQLCEHTPIAGGEGGPSWLTRCCLKWTSPFNSVSILYCSRVIQRGLSSQRCIRVPSLNVFRVSVTSIYSLLIIGADSSRGDQGKTFPKMGDRLLRLVRFSTLVEGDY